MSDNNHMLVFQVTNTEYVDSGCEAYFVFDKNGGTIGAGENNHWVIQDNLNTLPQDVARIEWRDKQYCILILGQATVFINHSPITPKSGFIRLGKGDLLKLGKIDIKVHIGDSNALNLMALSSKPEDVVNNSEDHLKNLIGDENVYETKFKEGNQDINNIISSDPLAILEDDKSLIFDHGGQDLSNYVDVKKLTYPHLTKSETMEKNTHFIDLPTASENNKSEYIENAYVTISPLLREMDMQVALENSQDINDILTEVGKTLNATINGLLSLQRQQNNLSDKHLRPIEDNPLRLNLDYPSTMEILFGNQKSPVHLAAPAAVSESLHNMLLHNDANKAAIVSALTAILHAFSPDVLLKRFENYRRSNELSENNASWAWEMYKSYYKELTSSRQQGFEKLFWEVYAQAYDKALRDSNIR